MLPIFLLALTLGAAPADDWPPPIEPLMRTVDLNLGESREVTLCDGSKATVKLLDLKEIRDPLRNAVREALATVEVNGRKATIGAANYRLPTTVGGAQIDCAVTKGFVQKDGNPWELDKDARLRLWPAGSPWIRPGTFVYPVRQRWFAGNTQMSNEPCFVNACDLPGQTAVYYHYGLDFGGAEGLTEVVAATDGVVVSARGKTIESADIPKVVGPRGDVVYLRDGRGWYYRYSHLHSIDPAVELGGRIKMGQKIGLLGKEGGSGGWAHLHFEIDIPQPSGRFGVTDGYAFAWQAAHRQSADRLEAVARPHRLAWVGDEVELDGRSSWSADGPKHIVRHEWFFGDGTTADGPTVRRRYDRCGQYSETLKVTDADGRVDYDFTVVVVYDRNRPKDVSPTIDAYYWPSAEAVKAGDELAFLVRSFAFAPDEGRERWDFGDGTPAVETRSMPVEIRLEGQRLHQHDKDGYAAVKHRYSKPGDYLVSVSRTNKRGETATTRLHVRVEKQ